jgi:hypothetical protein
VPAGRRRGYRFVFDYTAIGPAARLAGARGTRGLRLNGSAIRHRPAISDQDLRPPPLKAVDTRDVCAFAVVCA